MRIFGVKVQTLLSVPATTGGPSASAVGTTVSSSPRCPVCDSLTVTVTPPGGSRAAWTCDACGTVWSAALDPVIPRSPPTASPGVGRRPLNGSPSVLIGQLPGFVMGPESFDCGAIHTLSVPACPKCGRTDRATEDAHPGSSARWFACARCGVSYTRLPPRGT
jgi:transposase-like protein